MVGEIFRDASLGNAQMIGEQCFQIGIAAAGHAGARKSADRDAQGVAGFHMVVGSHVVVGEDEDAWPGGSMIGVIKFCGRTGEQTTELHFEQRKTGRKARVAETSLDAGGAGIRHLFDGEARNGAASTERGGRISTGSAGNGAEARMHVCHGLAERGIRSAWRQPCGDCVRRDVRDGGVFFRR